MSTKSTIILTNHNEHWYHEHSEYVGDGNENAIVLEFDKRNIRVDINDDEDLVITLINPESEIYKLIKEISILKQGY